MDLSASPEANREGRGAPRPHPSEDPSHRGRRPSHRRRKRRPLEIFALAVAVLSALGLGLVLLATCTQRDATPSGQVLAVVDGREITLQDVQAEARASDVPLTAANSAALLATVVDRTLLAEAARAKRLDQAATFPSDKVRAEQVLLANQLAAQERRSATPISDQEASDYVNANPGLFADRQDLVLEQVSFEASEAVMRQLGDIPTLGALLDGLDRLAVPHTTSSPTVSTADLAPGLAAALLKLGPDGVVVARQGSKVVASTVLSAEPRPMAMQEALPIAREKLQAARATAKLADRIAALRRAAKISYGEGYKAP